jgi:hypothetical protein
MSRRALASLGIPSWNQLLVWLRDLEKLTKAGVAV